MITTIGNFQKNNKKSVKGQLLTRANRAVLPPLLFLLLIAIGGGLVLSHATPFGLGLRDDSFTYISGAQTFAESLRYGRVSPEHIFKPITNFPPLYSISIAIVQMLGLNIFVAARYLNIFLFGLLILITGYGIFNITQSRVASIIGSLLVLTSEVLISQFTWALSESLFINLILIALLLLSFYIRKQGRMSYLIASSIFLGLAFFTRYAGIAFILSAVITIILYRENDLRYKVREAMLLLGVAIGPSLLFGLRNLILTGNLSNRPLPHFHPPVSEFWIDGGKTIIRWFSPDRFIDNLGSIQVLLVVLIASSIIFLILVRLFGFFKQQHVDQMNNPSLFTRILVLWILVYIVFLLITVLFLDRLTPLNNRILAPIHLFTLIFITLSFSQVSKRIGAWGRILFIITGMLVVGFQSYRAYHLLMDLNRDGQGYASIHWRESETLRYICDMPSVPIYSNDLPAIYFHCHRFARSIPYPVNLASQEVNDEYYSEIFLMREEIMNNDGLVAFLGWYGDDRLERTGFVEVVKGMTLIKTFDDGLIYSK